MHFIFVHVTAHLPFDLEAVHFVQPFQMFSCKSSTPELSSSTPALTYYRRKNVFKTLTCLSKDFCIVMCISISATHEGGVQVPGDRSG